MKILGYLSLIFGLLLIFGCKQKELHPKQKAVSEETSKVILNKTFKKFLPEFIKLRNISLVNSKRDTSIYNLYASIIVTENHLYFHLSDMNCNRDSHYIFNETFEGREVHFMVNSKSEKPWRLFDLEKTKLVQMISDEAQICEDWYFLAAKFRLDNNQLTLERISSFYDNSFQDDFYETGEIQGEESLSGSNVD